MALSANLLSFIKNDKMLVEGKSRLERFRDESLCPGVVLFWRGCGPLIFKSVHAG